MTVRELDQRARELRAQGLTYPEIGERMGESKARAWKRCNRDRDRAVSRRYKDAHRTEIRAYSRQYEEDHRHPCAECGKPIGRARRRCAGCRRAEYERKAEQVVALWNAGKSYAEIQAAMGWTKGMLSKMLHTYRTDGYDLPYRYTKGKRAGRIAA